MTRLNLSTLASNAARAKQRLIRQEARVRKLCDQLIERVGTGGETISTTLGQVIVTEQTFDRPGKGYTLIFNQEKFHELDPGLQMQLTNAGVVHPQKQMIRGCNPRVQFRLKDK
jgi:hypothetical protein